jgi:misacylated tRNA(Ala) deacylase
MRPTKRLYWLDDHCLEADAVVTGVREAGIALDQTCFYAGGGGQPADHGTITVGGPALNVTGMETDDSGTLWHQCDRFPPPDWVGRRARLQVNPERRSALSRYHTVLHVLNTIALHDYGAWITGAQIGVDYARIDFKWDGFSPALSSELVRKVNAELSADRRLRAYSLPEEEFSRRPELLRTMEVRPPVVDGCVRVVEIEGFDAQACGGTHVDSTGQLGQFTITRTENKGRINKRLYVRLTDR